MLFEEIKKRMMAAMKSGNVVEKEVLRTALGEITMYEKTSDDDVRAVIRKLLKSNRETLGLSTDPAQKLALAQEITVLQDFLPKTLDVAAITAALEPVKDAIRAAKNDGQAMGVASKHLKSAGAAVESEDVKTAIAQLRA
jgi:uncharacterized protein YqeY